MIITCGSCGKKMRVKDDVPNGQIVRCPGCGARTKIELDQSKKSAGSCESSTGITDPVRDKPKLGIRRRSEVSQQGNSHNGVVSAVEGRYDAAIRAARRRKLKQTAWNVLSVVILALMAFAGYSIYRKGCDTVRKETSTLTNGDNENDNGSASATGTIIHENDENEAAKARREENLARQGLNKDAEREIGDEVLRQAKEKYNSIVASFKDAELNLWRNLAKSKRPGTSRGVFVAAIPTSREETRLYEIESTTNGIGSISLLPENGLPKIVSQSDFEERLNNRGGFILVDGTAYAFRPKSGNRDFQPPQSSGQMNPSKEYFGQLYDYVRQLGLNCDGIRYEVTFAFPSDAKPILVKTVRHGEGISHDAFLKIAESVAKEVQRKQMPMDLKMKKYKRTVVFYNGSFISRGIGGVTKIPYKWTSNDQKGYLEWCSLRDKANRQENEAKRVAEENARKAAEWKKKVHGPPDRQLVQKVFYSGKTNILPMMKGGEK